MFHIIGVNHRVQGAKSGVDRTADQVAYAECLARAIDDHTPDLVAEEHSPEALASCGQDISVTKEVAAAGGVEHKFCDPTTEQRAAIGYKDAYAISLEISLDDPSGLSQTEIKILGQATAYVHYFPIREQFWLDEMKDYTAKEVVFVCGSDHIASFQRLLESKCIPSAVLVGDIGMSADDKKEHEDTIDYIRSHPGIKKR
ncbi:MAG: hypothetical protein HY046_06255 [Acidobacteria bacterium]|nr:hypothetical protein [Acidobacteriota bacterium]